MQRLNFTIAFLVMILACLLVIAFYVTVKPPNQVRVSPELTTDTQSIDWGAFGPGGSSTRQLNLTSTTNATLTAALINPQYEDLPKYLSISVEPQTLTANQPTTVYLTLTAREETPPLQFTTDIQLTAS